MSTVASIALAVLYIGLVIWLFAYVRKAKEERRAAMDATKEQAQQIKDIQDAISASPFVQYPYIYSSATRKY